jgi:hypothetical protein
VRIDALDPSDPALVCLGDLAVAEAFEIASIEDNRNRIQLMSNYRRTLLAVAGLLPAHDASEPDEFEAFLSDLNGPCGFGGVPLAGRRTGRRWSRSRVPSTSLDR